MNTLWLSLAGLYLTALNRLHGSLFSSRSVVSCGDRLAVRVVRGPDRHGAVAPRVLAVGAAVDEVAYRSGVLVVEQTPNGYRASTYRDYCAHPYVCSGVHATTAEYASRNHPSNRRGCSCHRCELIHLGH